MIGNAKNQTAERNEFYQDQIQIPPERPEDFDYRNLSDFFRLLLKVDQRINPQKYIIKQNNQNQND